MAKAAAPAAGEARNALRRCRMVKHEQEVGWVLGSGPLLGFLLVFSDCCFLMFPLKSDFGITVKGICVLQNG